MGGITGASKQATTVASLQFQTSAKGGALPLLYGSTRIAGNLLDYDDFTTIGGTGKSGGKGGGGGKGSGSKGPTYTASAIFGICQGPIENLGVVWFNRTYGGLDTSAATLYAGEDGQAADSTYAAAHPDKALGYSGTANIVANNLNLGSSPVLPNFSFEAVSKDALADAPNGFDCKPATIVTDFLTNERYGAGFPSANLGDLSDYLSYCDAVGIWLSVQLDTAKDAQQWLADITDLTNSGIVWSGDKLKVIPYGDIDISASHTLVAYSGAVATGDVVSMTFTDAGLSGSPLTIGYTVVSEDVGFLLIVLRGLVKAINGNLALVDFGISAIAGGNEILIRQEPAGSVAITGTGAVAGSTVTHSFSPDTAPIYDLTEGDFIVAKSTARGGASSSPGGDHLGGGGGEVTGASEPPVRIARKSPADADNMIEVEFLDRCNHYNTDLAEDQDQAALDLYGVRRGSPITAHAVCDAGMAQRVAQLAMFRAQNYWNTYTFRLSWKYCLLEPMDLIRISAPSVGIDQLPVRITAVEEDELGSLAMTAEDFVPGSSLPVRYPSQSPSGQAPNYSIDPGDVNEPLIFYPPAALRAHVNQLWIGASGRPEWGSALVYISIDATSYSFLGEVVGQMIQGELTADLDAPIGAIDPDTDSVMSVDLTESRGQQSSVSPDNAEAMANACIVGDEILSFEIASITGPYQYDLTNLWRGAFGTTPAFVGSGSRFNRITTVITAFNISPSLAGKTLYFKFVSRNIYGGGEQDLSDVTAYSFFYDPD